MKDNNIIYKDDFSIDGLKSMMNNVCKVLNRNHKKVLAFNPNLPYQITLEQSFYDRNNNLDNDSIISNTYNVLKNIIKDKSPFYTDGMIDDYYKKLMTYLHYNDYRELNGFRIKEDSNPELEAKNIEHISRSISFLFNVGEGDKYMLAKKYIQFEDGLFIPNEKLLAGFEIQKTYLTLNKNQQKALEIIRNINDSFKQLNKINSRLVSKNLLSDFDCNYISSTDLVRYIYEI